MVSNQIQNASSQHRRIIRAIRLYLPVLAVLFGVCWLVYSSLNQVLTLRGVAQFIRNELDQIQNGQIETLDEDTSGALIVRLIEFEKMAGTGLTDSPFQLGAVTMTYWRNGEGLYDYRSANAVLDPIGGVLDSTANLLILGPDGFRMETKSAKVSIGAFDAASDQPVILTADGGMILEAEGGFTFDPLNQSASFVGPVSLNISSQP